VGGEQLRAALRDALQQDVVADVGARQLMTDIEQLLKSGLALARIFEQPLVLQSHSEKSRSLGLYHAPLRRDHQGHFAVVTASGRHGCLTVRKHGGIGNWTLGPDLRCYRAVCEHVAPSRDAEAIAMSDTASTFAMRSSSRNGDGSDGRGLVFV